MKIPSFSMTAGLLVALACSTGCGDDSSASGGGATNAGGSGGSGGAGPSGSGGAGGAGAGSTGSGGGAGGASDDYRRVFVTSKTFNGDLGGLAGADADCQTLADGESLGGTWLAWLSDGDPGMATVVDRLDHGAVPYVLVGGSEIAANWDDLLDGSIDLPIDHDESGAAILEGDETKVWTGTVSDGSAGSPGCSGWTTLESGASYGLTTATDAAWTSAGGTTCDTLCRLYCFEQ